MSPPFAEEEDNTCTNKRKSPGKKPWDIFWDLQCLFSKTNWELLPEIRKKFEDEFEFTIHITSLLFHPQAFTAQCAAELVEAKKGEEARMQFIDACFQNQESYMNSAVGDARRSEVDAIFADIAEQCGILDEKELTKEHFLAKIHDWEIAVKPAWTNHKEALAQGVFAVPKSVIDGTLVTDSESSWGPEKWEERIKKL
jgi:hypothetical protein